MKLAFFYYHVADNNVFETCIKTLRKHSDCKIVIYTDNMPDTLAKQWAKNYGVDWKYVSSSEYEGRGAFCKIKVMEHYLSSMLDFSQVVVLDADLYFMGDPFQAFNAQSFDIALTTRCHEYHFKINGGVFYFVMGYGVRDYLKWHVEQCLNPTWVPYVAYRRKHDHERFGLSWTIGQDFLNVSWDEREDLKKKFGINIVDVGSKYNYCPAWDFLGRERANEKMLKAYKHKRAIVLHLKSEFKEMIYQGVFADAVTSNRRGTLKWAELREKIRDETRKKNV